MVVDRLPSPDDPDLLAVVRPVDGEPDTALAGLASAIPRRRTNRCRFDARLPSDLLRALAQDAALEDTELIPVLREDHLQLLARLTQQADQVQTPTLPTGPNYAAGRTGRPPTATGSLRELSPTSTAANTTPSPSGTSTPPARESCPPTHTRGRTRRSSS